MIVDDGLLFEPPCLFVCWSIGCERRERQDKSNYNDGSTVTLLFPSVNTFEPKLDYRAPGIVPCKEITERRQRTVMYNRDGNDGDNNRRSFGNDVSKDVQLLFRGVKQVDKQWSQYLGQTLYH